MNKYFEKYIINGHSCSITELGEASYQVRFGGYVISTAKTVGEARKTLHTYMVSQLRAERAGFYERATNADRALTKLGEDEFNLGRFRVGH